jgi:Rrf2 family protein
MNVSQKCQYALRAIFELAKHEGQTPLKAGQIAEAQVIPARFLEVILNELKQGGFIVSRRGAEGGYLLARSPGAITMGDIIQFIDGSFGPLKATEGEAAAGSRVSADAVLEPVWNQAVRAASQILDRTTFASLVEEERQQAMKQVVNYSI